MNAFELRKLLMNDAAEIVAEARERMSSNIDPFTGERWEGDRQLFLANYKALLGFADKSDDPTPPLRNNTTPLEKLQDIIDCLFSGGIDTNKAAMWMKMAIEYMNAEQRAYTMSKVDEVNNVHAAVRMLELQQMTDSDLSIELEAARVRMMGERTFTYVEDGPDPERDSKVWEDPDRFKDTRGVLPDAY